MYEVQAPLSLIFTLFFLHFLSLLYWQCMLLHVIFGILHHSFLIICVRQSAVSGLPPNVVIYNMTNFLSGKTQMPLHIAAAFKQRKEFFGGESVLCIGKVSLPHLLYIQYTRFSGVRKFLSDFLPEIKKRLTALFQIRKLFSFVFFLMYSRAYVLALIISAASICGINLSIVLAVMISFFRN